MSRPATSTATRSAISLPASAAGPLQLDLFPGLTSVSCGPAPAPANPSVLPADGQAQDDKRHLWPEFRRFIAQRAPAIVFGEQVASNLGRGMARWSTPADLEDLAYAVGAADLCAAGLGAPHIRQRLFWVADTEGSATGGSGERDCRDARQMVARIHREQGSEQASAVGSWSRYDLVPRLDGKARRVEPRVQPLADGVPARVGRLRLRPPPSVPQVAATFMRAWMETKQRS